MFLHVKKIKFLLKTIYIDKYMVVFNIKINEKNNNK